MTQWNNFNDTKPEPFARILVAGWRDRSGSVAGYWWWEEGCADEKGSAIDCPKALLWTYPPELPTTPPRGGTR